MKHVQKLIAVFLTAILIATIALPIVSFAEVGVPNDHTTFEEFWDQMTDDEGNIDWKALPKVLFKAFVWIRIFEVIAGFFRDLFGPSSPETQVPETTVAAEVTTAAEALA